MVDGSIGISDWQFVPLSLSVDFHAGLCKNIQVLIRCINGSMGRYYERN